MNVTGVVLAAGQGKRMHSKLSKVLHPLLGREMLLYVLEAVREVTNTQPVFVIGHEADAVREKLGEAARVVVQEKQLGTGHAVLQVKPLLRGNTDLVLVTNGDMPLLTSETYQRLITAQKANPDPITMLTVETEDPHGFGRVVRDDQGFVQCIVEEAQATPEQMNIRELNVGAYCFDSDWLWEALPQLGISPKGEYYLTDLIYQAVSEGIKVQALCLEDPTEAIGINNRVHLAEAEALMRQRINRRLMLEGVTIMDPQTTYIGPEVTVGQDSFIWPNTYLLGKTTIGEDCELGPNTLVHDTRIGNGVKVLASVLENAVVEDEVNIGPFAHLRSGAHLARGVHMGNFGEVKSSYLGPGTKMGHFSYIGDATIGPDVNIGAGTITCNFDGERKHPTKIGAGVFIGSDTMLVAPISLGDGARTGAGSVVTKDVEPYHLVVGVPARAIRKLISGE
ncbi:MAG: bifunctional UDP-N-acetylglucosamine diphosphorylase/glucosamine-1-phosphate N-acetyltransferase GlmU [Chloroflexota bacterium]